MPAGKKLSNPAAAWVARRPVLSYTKPAVPGPANSDAPTTVPLTFSPVTQDPTPPSVPSSRVAPLLYSAALGRCATARSPATWPALLMATGLRISGISTSAPLVLIQLRTVLPRMDWPTTLRPAVSMAVAKLLPPVPTGKPAMGLNTVPK